MLTRSDSKFIKSLQLKKYRKSSGLFVTEGAKNILELARSDYEINRLFLTRSFYEQERVLLQTWFNKIEFVTQKELIQCGTFKTNDAGIALAVIRDAERLNSSQPLTLLLDEIRDPGNLGTIIRIADWYGMDEIICSPGCADCYNPKVINSSMGSVFRINCAYRDLPQFISETKYKDILGAVMDGQSVHEYGFSGDVLLVLGNESTGISPSLMPYLTGKITIPGAGRAESLNVAMATAIICDNYYRFLDKPEDH